MPIVNESLDAAPQVRVDLGMSIDDGLHALDPVFGISDELRCCRAWFG
jgi:hypothetical protein